MNSHYFNRLYNSLQPERLVVWDLDYHTVGKRNSILSRVIIQHPDVFSMSCVCHLAALCAAAGLKKLPLSTYDLLIDVYYHFKNSSKRCEEFSIILQEFDGIAPVRVLKHCSTRWLSFERAIKRLLILWPAFYT